MPRPIVTSGWIRFRLDGEDGTLATRFGKDAKGRQIRAKTGSLSHVNALAGYAGDRYVFSIFANNTNVSALMVRTVMDRLALRSCNNLFGSKQAPSHYWDDSYRHPDPK